MDFILLTTRGRTLKISPSIVLGWLAMLRISSRHAIKDVVETLVLGASSLMVVDSMSLFAT